MKLLSGLDAAFLYLETPRMPLHVAALRIFDAETAGGRLDFLTFRDHLAARLHRARVFRQRLVMVPLGLGHPYWIEDPDFDLDLHLRHLHLPQPGGWFELRTLVSHVVSRPLDRSRPLWEMTFVDGLDAIAGAPPGSVALIAKVHHAAADGVAGCAMMDVLLDPTPEPCPEPTPMPWNPVPAPGELAILTQTSADYLRWPQKFVDLLSATARSAAKLPFVPHIEGAHSLPRLYAAPHTGLNRPVSAQRVWDCAAISLQRVKAVKNVVPGISVNDVVLAICAGALRRYLEEKHNLPEQPLVAMMPISLHPQGEQRAEGNQVSAMLIELATDEGDPVQRLHRIHAGTCQAKAYHSAVDAPGLIAGSQLIPFALASLGVQLYTGLRVTEVINPIFNCVITNVPGSQAPMYLHGARMLMSVGMTPIYDGVGLLLTIFSYAGVLTVTASSCPEIMPDIDRFVRYVEEALVELESKLVL